MTPIHISNLFCSNHLRYVQRRDQLAQRQEIRNLFIRERDAFSREREQLLQCKRDGIYSAKQVRRMLDDLEKKYGLAADDDDGDDDENANPLSDSWDIEHDGVGLPDSDD